MEIKKIEGLLSSHYIYSVEHIEQLADRIDQSGFYGAIVVRDGKIEHGTDKLLAVRQLLAADKHIYPTPGRLLGVAPYIDGNIPVLDLTGCEEIDFEVITLL